MKTNLKYVFLHNSNDLLFNQRLDQVFEICAILKSGISVLYWKTDVEEVI